MGEIFKGFMRDFFAVKFNADAHDPQSERINGDGGCYPNCDSSIWLRSCEKEIIEPIYGQVTGQIPNWLNGALLRNGPGNLKVGDMQFKHLFDSSALLHRFAIKNGIVTYQCRFIQTETRKKNLAAQRIVVTEFGTSTVPDPCQSIFQRVAAIFDPDNSTDNTMISIYPFGDEYYTFTESPVIHRINPVTLKTEGRLRVSDFVGVVSHTSHPHIMPDKTVYNLGMSATKLGPAYNIICFPKGESMFEDAHIVGTIPCRWRMHPGYMHTFGITKNYFIIVEQPMSISLTEYVKNHLTNQQTFSSLKWFDDKSTYIYLMERKTGKLAHTYRAEGFFYLHIINQYEENDHVIVDICCYKDPSMLNCMYIDSIINMQNNPNYAAMFRGRPLRFILPIPKLDITIHQKGRLTKSISLASIQSRLSIPKTYLKRSESSMEDVTYLAHNLNNDQSNNISAGSSFDIRDAGLKNLVNLENSKAQAFKLPDGMVFVRPELLCDLGCETPRINYENYLGKKYKYFYAISSDVDCDNPGTLIKVDTVNKTRLLWCENNCYPSEPVFVPSPGSTSEDDGIVLSALVWGSLRENYVGLLILDAKTWTELGRCEFRTPGPVPKCLHGWFAPNKDINQNQIFV